MSDKTIDYTHMELKDFMSFISTGSYGIPNFQRDYVWEKEKIVNFVNSILDDEPFGFIINWKTPNSLIETRNEIIKDLSENSQKTDTYIIDGQQRLTSLFSLFSNNKLKGRQTITGTKIHKMKLTLNSIHFNVNSMKFEKSKNKKIKDIQIPVYDAIGAWHSTLEDIEKNINENNEYSFYTEEEKQLIISRIKEVNKKLRKVKVGMINLEGYNIDEVIEIFNKINTQGKKLSIFEIINSKWHAAGVNLENEFAELIDYSSDNLMGEMDNVIPMDAFFLVVNNDPIISGKDKFEYNINFNLDEMNKIISKFKASFKMAIDFLRDKSFSSRTLPSKLIIKWLSYLYFKNNNKKLNYNQSNIVFKYISLLSLNSFYSSSTNTRMKENIDFVNYLLENNTIKMKKIFDSFRLKNISKEDIIDIEYKTTTMVSYLVKHLLYNKSFDLKNGTTISIAKSKDIDIHHLFAKKAKTKNNKTYDSEYENEINSIANLMPIESSTNKDFIKNKLPSVYYEELKKENKYLDENLKCCFINVELFKGDQFLKFIDDRAKNISSFMNGNYFEYDSLFEDISDIDNKSKDTNNK